MSFVRALTATTAALCFSLSAAPTAFAQTAPSISSYSSAKFETLLAVPQRPVSDGSDQAALKAMGMDKIGKGDLRWKSKTGSNGNYTFTGLTPANILDRSMNIDRLSFQGLRMENGNPTFDRLDMFALTFEGGKEGDGSIGQMSISQPSPDFARDVIKTFKSFDYLDRLDDLDFEEIELNLAGAFYLKDLDFEARVDGDYQMMKAAELGWGTNPNTDRGNILLRDFSLDGTADDSGEPVKMSVKNFEFNGVRMEYVRATIEDLKAEANDEKLSQADRSILYQNPYVQNYDSAYMNEVFIEMDGLRIGLDDYTSKVTPSGNDLRFKSSMSGLGVSFTGVPEDAELADMKSSLESAGFDDLNFDMNFDSVYNERNDSFDNDGTISLRDGFDIKFNTSGNGLKRFFEQMMASENANDMEMDELMGGLEDLKVNHLDLTFRDQSIIDKALNIAAAEGDTTPELLRGQAKAMTATLPFMAQNEAQMEIATQLGTSLVSLLDDGGAVKISLRPRSPLTMQSFMDADMSDFDPSFMGISVTHID